MPLSVRRKHRRKSFRLPSWYAMIREQCARRGLNFQRRYKTGKTRRIDPHKAVINEYLVRLAFSGSVRFTSNHTVMRYSNVSIPGDIAAYAYFLIAQRVRKIACCYVIPARRLVKIKNIDLPAQKESRSQWDDFRDNWGIFVK